jgi:hypothetical protein
MTDLSLPAGAFAEPELRIGRIFTATWSVFSRNFLAFMAIAALASLPPLLLDLQGHKDLGKLVGFVLSPFSQAMMVYGAFQVMLGQRFNIAESARIGLRRFPPILALSILVPLGIGLAALALIVPGIILYMMWFVTTPACVVEQLGPIRSLERSNKLTYGHRWQILGLNLVILILFIVASVIASAIMAVLFDSAGASMVEPALELLWSTAGTALYAIVGVVTYRDLRVAKEGVDTSQIAAVFD